MRAHAHSSTVVAPLVFGAILPVAAARQGADVLMHDAQLLAEELAAQAAFGYAAADYAVALARRAGARRVVLFHHQPDRADAVLDQLARWFAASSVPSRWPPRRRSLTYDAVGLHARSSRYGRASSG